MTVAGVLLARFKKAGHVTHLYKVQFKYVIINPFTTFLLLVWMFMVLEIAFFRLRWTGLLSAISRSAAS